MSCTQDIKVEYFELKFIILKNAFPEAGEISQWLRTVAALAEVQVQFPAPILRLTTIYNSSSKGI